MDRFNCIIVDWCSFTILDPDVTPEDVVYFLGLPLVSFISRSGYNGYKDQLFFDNISVNYNGRSDMGVNVLMTGSGCRAFETYAKDSDFINLFKRLFLIYEKVNIARFDLAYDDYKNMIKLNKVKKSIENLSGVYSPAHIKSWNTNNSDKGLTLGIGSRSSEMYIRFYDKAAERKVDFPWVRCELQMRSDVALFAFQHFIKTENLSDLFFGLLNNYCQFVNKKDVNHAGRSDLQPWFKKWTSTRDILHYTRATKEYNLEKIRNNVIEQYGNSIQAYISAYGISDLITRLNQCRPISDMPLKYKNLLIDHCVDIERNNQIKEVEHDDFIELVDDVPYLIRELEDKLDFDFDNV